jgi:hypothetical protein
VKPKSKTTRGSRFQVLADGTPIIEKSTRKQAESIANQWRAEGKQNVRVWDTLSNPMTSLFRL